jgi:thioredoxin reductase (NADPH)
MKESLLSGLGLSDRRREGSRSPIAVADPSDRRFPVFPPEVLEELFESGERRELAAGDVLCRAGQASSDFFVLIDGEV